MSDLDRMFDELAVQPVYTKSIETVPVDFFERDNLAEFDEIPGLADLRDRADVTVLHAPELVQDLNALFWKSEPKVRDESELDVSALLNRVAVEAVRNNPDTEELRRHTTYDMYASALATMSVADEVIEVLGRHAEKMRDLAEQEPPPPSPDGQPGDGDQPGDQPGDGDQPGGTGMTPEEFAQAVEDITNQAAAELGKALSGAIASQLEDRKEEEANWISWGVDPGEVKRMNFNDRLALSKRLSQSKMAKWRGLFGKFRFTARAMNSKKVEYGRDELYSITLGRDLAEVLPSEFAMLASPSLKPLFMRKFAEGQLLSQKWRGKQRAGDGPIVVCLDSSRSMEGAREAWSKACALGLMEVAKKDNRAFTTLIFGSRHQLQRVDGTGLDAMLEVGEKFFDGGTDFDRPLTEAMRIIAHDKEHEKSDIVIITDGECDMSKETWAAIAEAKAKGLRVFGIDLGGGRTPVLERLCDNVRFISDLRDPNTVADLYAVM